MNNPLYAPFVVVVNFALMLIFLRFMFQLAGINKNHPYTKALYRLSAVVDVFGRIFPTLKGGRVNTSALALMLLLWFVNLWGKTHLMGESFTALQFFFLTTTTAIVAFLTALRWVLIASVICSFVVLLSQKIHPIVDITMELAEPIIAPFRKISPNMGMLDIAPLFAFLTIMILIKIIGVLGADIWQKIS